MACGAALPLLSQGRVGCSSREKEEDLFDFIEEMVEENEESGERCLALNGKLLFSSRLFHQGIPSHQKSLCYSVNMYN